MELKRPDPHVQISWSVYALLLSLIPAAVSVALFRLFFIPHRVAVAFTVTWAVVLLLTLIVYFPLRYRNARYGVDDTRITVISGVYFISHRQMPLSSVRHITVIRGPLERLFGTAFVAVSAAGGWLLLEGVPAAEAHRWSEQVMFR